MKAMDRATASGWIITLLGCVLWTYGYFTTGSPQIYNWAEFAPSWIAEYLPNWQAELGLLLTILGSVPIYYVQIKTYREDKQEG